MYILKINLQLLYGMHKLSTLEKKNSKNITCVSC
jgi:hypothetical protein